MEGAGGGFLCLGLLLRPPAGLRPAPISASRVLALMLGLAFFDRRGTCGCPGSLVCSGQDVSRPYGGRSASCRGGAMPRPPSCAYIQVTITTSNWPPHHRLRRSFSSRRSQRAASVFSITSPKPTGAGGIYSAPTISPQKSSCRIQRQPLVPNHRYRFKSSAS